MNSRIPDRDECLALIATHRMLPHIREHSRTVCAVALWLARSLNAGGFHFDLAEVQAAALLHDITKTRSLETGEDHARSGAALLQELGFHRIARIVAQHIQPDVCDDAISVAELISYADKRVLHDRPVSLHKRFEYLVQRYGHTEQARERIQAALRRTQRIECKIMRALHISDPEQLYAPASPQCVQPS